MSTDDEIAESVGDEIVRDREHREALMVEIPADIMEIIDKRAEQTGKPKWEIVAASIAVAEGGSELATIPQIEQAIEREEQKAADLEREAEMKLDKAQDRRDRADALRRRKAKIERETEARIDALDDVLGDVIDRGTHAAVGVGPVPKLADGWFDGDQAKAIEALKSRAQEIDAEVPAEQFSAPNSSDTETASATTSASANGEEGELKSLQQLRDGDRRGDENEQEQEPEQLRARTDGGSQQ